MLVLKQLKFFHKKEKRGEQLNSLPLNANGAETQNRTGDTRTVMGSGIDNKVFKGKRSVKGEIMI